MNWYAMYTRPGCEKKVARSLTKRGIENFCPLNYRKPPFSSRKTPLEEPLFKSYVFVKASGDDIINVSKQIQGVISFLYWLGKPATINEEDIHIIKEFTNSRREIKLEKLQVNLKAGENVVDDISFSINGKILMIKTRIVKINLPSLGFTLIADMEGEGTMRTEAYFDKKKSLVHD